jgi:short subunit dehydrogenase-like uncharacterized protein
MIHPIDKLPEDQLVRHRCDTGKAIANPRLASLDRNEPIDIPIIQAWSDRHDELKMEFIDAKFKVLFLAQTDLQVTRLNQIVKIIVIKTLLTMTKKVLVEIILVHLLNEKLKKMMNLELDLLVVLFPLIILL